MEYSNISYIFVLFLINLNDMKRGKSYEEYLQSDWYKMHLDKNKTNKNAKTLSLEVKEKSYQKVKRNKVLNYIKSMNL